MVVRDCLIPSRVTASASASPSPEVSLAVVTMARRRLSEMAAAAVDGGRFTIDGSGRNRTRDLRDLGRISADGSWCGRTLANPPTTLERGAQEGPPPVPVARPSAARTPRASLPSPAPNLG